MARADTSPELQNPRQGEGASKASPEISSEACGRVHPDHMPIYHQGDTVTGFYRVKSGVVMAYRLLENSQRHISGFYTEGDFFGLSSHAVYQDTAVTITTANVAFLTLGDVQKNQTLQQELFAATCRQLDAAQTLITTLTRKSASEKLATFLVMLARDQHRKGFDFALRLPMSRQDIADYLGLSIETVSRRLTDFKTRGIIGLPDRNSIHVLDFAHLLGLAGEP